MKSYIARFATLMVLILLALATVAGGASMEARKTAGEQFSNTFPQTQFYYTGSQITHIYGSAFGQGSNPEDAAEQFRKQFAPILGVDPGELLPTSFVVKDGHTQGVMYENGRYKFTLVYYSQYRDGIPVYRSDLRLLVRNEPGYPLVLASSAVKDLGDYTVDAAKASIDPKSAQAIFAAKNLQYNKYTEPQQVIWAGIDEPVAPAFGIAFIADDGNEPTVLRDLIIIDPSTAEILYQESQVVDVNVTGTVTGLGTEQFKAEQCGNEISRPLPYATATIVGGSSAYADSSGNFSITNGGSSAVTVWSRVKGHWFIANNQAGANDSVAMVVTPPGPANFVHNPTNTEYKRAEVNAYIAANAVRDFTLHFNPTYPTIYTQTNFPLHCNDNTGYCPGNAWYDGISLTFCRASSPYPNTAFSTVAHHEYGHHLVSCAGSGQDQYGEGMGDVMGLLITDDPGTGYGFFGSCTTPLRDADNTIQYPCTDEMHACAPLMSGCVWSIRNQLAITNPTNYINILANLAINAMLLHTGQNITPQITIDYLTLDDDNDNLNDGTPHHAEICAGFGAHNMDCPALSLITFAYPNGKPAYVSPSGGTTMRVTVAGVGATPQPNTGVLHYNGGSGWQTSSMTQVSSNVYDAIFPAFACRTTINYYISVQTTTGATVNDPDNAPAGFYSTLSASGVVSLFYDDFSTTQAWTGLGGAAEWTIGPCVGGSGSDTHGGPDPATDHSPTSDNRVLGNDLTSDGDYNPNIRLPQYVTSPTINCTGYTGITLDFWRCLGVERINYDTASFEVYNGSTWTVLFQNGATTIDDTTWKHFTYDVSAYANNNANFKMRFGLGGTDGAWQWCGWNIDDITVSTIRCDTLPSGTLAGTITDSQGNVSGAIVHAVNGGTSRWDTTAANGAYSLAAPAGTYSVAYTHVDHRDTTISGIVITSGNTTTRNVVMQRLPGVIKGKVTIYPSTTIGASNIRVVVNGIGRADTTDASGNYLINNITEGTYSMLFTNPDYRDTTLSGVAVTPGDSTTRNVQMVQYPGYIAGTVRDSTGAPVENVFVRINTGALILSAPRNSDSESADIPVIASVDSMYTNASGYYISRSLALGTYNVRFTHITYRDTTIHNVTVTGRDTTLVSPTLKRRNRAPVITSPASTSATEGVLFRYTATASDSDGVVPTIAFGNYPVWMSVTADTIRGIPPVNSGNVTFKIIASDGYLADTLIVTVTVLHINHPPVITSPAVDSAVVGDAYQYIAIAEDPDGTTPVIGFYGYPSWLTTTGNVIYGTPFAGRHDTVFTVTASDGQLADTQVVSLHIIGANDPPVITSDANVTAFRGSSFDYLATATDPNGDDIAFSFIHYPSWTTPNPPHLQGTPGANAADTSFDVIASDGSLADTMLVTVTMQTGGCSYVTGDVNGSGSLTGQDVTYGVRFFKGGPAPQGWCECPAGSGNFWYVTGDVNGSCSFTGQDVTYLVRFFKGGSEPIPCPDCPSTMILGKKTGRAGGQIGRPSGSTK